MRKEREFCSRSLTSHPSPGSLLKAPMLSPKLWGRGRTRVTDRLPRVPRCSTLGYSCSALSGLAESESFGTSSDSWLLVPACDLDCGAPGISKATALD